MGGGGGRAGKDNLIDHSLVCKELFFYQATFVSFYFTACQLSHPLNEYLDACESPRVPITNEVLLAGNNVLDSL